MPTPAPKKMTCRICGTEHNVGEPCPECQWDEIIESRKAKGEAERLKLREEAQADEKKKKRPGGGSIWD